MKSVKISVIKRNDIEKQILLDEDLSEMSLFFSEVVLVVINKIIFVLNNNSITKGKIENILIKEKDKKDKNKKTAYPISELEILNLFYKLFPENKREVILDNLTKLKELISSDRCINIFQLNGTFINKEIRAITLTNDIYGLLSEPILMNSDTMLFLLKPIHFMNEEFYATILHELTHIVLNSNDITNYKFLDGFPYGLHLTEFVKNMNLSDNADSYPIFIFTSIFFMEEEPENNISLKKFNKVNERYKNFLDSQTYQTLLDLTEFLNKSPTDTIEKLTGLAYSRKAGYTNKSQQA